jgi:hypothetical protein
MIIPSSGLADITHLVLQSYLGRITGIEVWDNFSPNLGIPTVSGVYAIDAAANVGANTIVVDNGQGAAPEPLVKGYQLTIVGSSTVHTITGVAVGATEHTYTISPVLDQAVADADLLTIATPCRYSGCIWPYQYSAETIALKQPTIFTIQWGIRLLIASPDVSLSSIRATQWARILDRILESVTTIQGQSVYGISIAGTYDGVVVQPGSTIAIGRRSGWNILTQENQDGGAISSVQTSFSVTN